MTDDLSPSAPPARPWERGHDVVAVATDVGAWRVVLPVLRELDRRGSPYRVMLAEPAATIARQDGMAHVALSAASLDDRVDAILAARPMLLLLGTSVQAVVERALVRRLRVRGQQIPTLGVLDAMLFVERRFGPGLADLPDLVACPDRATAWRLRQAGAPEARLAVTGNPTLEEIRLTASATDAGATDAGAMNCAPTVSDPVGARFIAPTGRAAGPVDVLFVSSPVAAMRLRGAEFAIDDREALADVLAALAALTEPTPAGYRVRIRLHPVQRDEGLPIPPPGITLELDDDPDRLRSCAQAQVVVGLSSTLLGEARFLPRSAIAYLPGPFWEQERVFAPEYGVYLARSSEDLQQRLGQALREPPSPPPAGHLGAAGRIANLLQSLTERRP